MKVKVLGLQEIINGPGRTTSVDCFVRDMEQYCGLETEVKSIENGDWIEGHNRDRSPSKVTLEGGGCWYYDLAWLSFDEVDMTNYLYDHRFGGSYEEQIHGKNS